MKYFWVFGWDQYYPRGGLRDFLGAFETEIEVKDFIEEKKKSDFCLDEYRNEDVSKVILG
jgi:hypothetical protein